VKKVDIGLFSIAVAKNIVFQDDLPSSQIFEVFSLTFLPFSEVSNFFISLVSWRLPK